MKRLILLLLLAPFCLADTVTPGPWTLQNEEFATEPGCVDYATSLAPGTYECTATTIIIVDAPPPPPPPPPPPANDPGATVTTANEVIPNPVYGSSVRVATAGDWNDPNTWTTGIVPGPSSAVIIDGTVTITADVSADHVGIYPGGVLSFGQNSKLSAANVIVFESGTLSMGTAVSPVAAEIVLTDTALTDHHLGTLTSINGVVNIHGVPREAFYRMTTEADASDTLINVTDTATWQIGDSVLIPKSTVCRKEDGMQDCGDQTEERTITAMTSNSITLDSPLTYDHPGVDGNLPHVINVERSIIIRSEDPLGVRGHALFHECSDINIRYAAFLDMGRTDIQNLSASNQKGRYPLHLHHASCGFDVTGNVIDFGPENDSLDKKWGLTVHNSPNGYIVNNVIYRASGAGLAQEDDTQGNSYLDNFVVFVLGGNGAQEVDQDPGDNSKLGRSGVGYWFNGGQGNTYDGNVVAHVRECVYCYGFKFDNKHGSDYSTGLTFPNNEAYAVPSGLTIWWICIDFETPTPGCMSLVDDFRVWNFHRWGYFGYETSRLTLRNFHTRVDFGYLSNPYNYITGIWFADYQQQDLIIEDMDLGGLGLTLPSNRSRDPVLGKTVVCGGSADRIKEYRPASSNGVPGAFETFINGVTYNTLAEDETYTDVFYQADPSVVTPIYINPIKDCSL